MTTAGEPQVEFDALGLIETTDYDEEPPELAITDRASADRHLAHIARLEHEYELEKQGVLETVERLQQWLAARYESVVAQTDWHRDVLRRYHTAVLAVDPRLKTIELPHGKLQSRAQQPTWEFDAPVFLEWAAVNQPSVVRPPKPADPTLDVAAAKRLLDVVATDEKTVVLYAGEIVPGVTVTMRDPKLSIVVGEGE